MKENTMKQISFHLLVTCLATSFAAVFALSHNTNAIAAEAPALPQAPAATRTPPPPPARGPALDVALEAAQIALATCTANGYKTGVVVVDSAGILKVVLAADGASQRAVDSATGKAFTVITYKSASSVVAKQAEADKDLAARLAADPKQRARAGALPLLVSGELIGAIGVGGAPGGEKDEVCASAGIDKVRDRLK
jgi:uncharacterized protein GlcG (DUF336 family)